MTTPEELSNRVGCYLDYFQEFKKLLYRPEVSPFVGIDEVKLALALGFYFKDRDRIKAEHKLKRMHRSKVAAYTIHWLKHFTPIYCVLGKEDLDKLSSEEQDDILHANYRFAVYLVFQILDEIDPDDFLPDGHYHQPMLDLSYYLFTNTYNPEIASIFFAALSYPHDQSH